MLNSLKIKNFRAFKDLRVDSIERVNLVVGQNNIGKTSLLEAVHLYSSDEVVSAAIRLLQRRQEYFLEENSHVVLLGRLFHQDSTEPIEIGEISGENQLVMRRKWRWNRDGEDDGRLEWQDGDHPPQGVERTELLTIYQRPKPSHTIQMYSDESLAKRSWLHRSSNSSLFLSYSGFQADSINTAELWDRIVLTDNEHDVLGALEVVEPALERIVMVQGGRPQRTAMVKLPDRPPIPLHSLGDGMNRLFELSLGLVNVGKVFLVDEIDSGLHYTTLVDVWRLVFETAAKLQVQVFATTHSWDCIEAFQQAAAEHPSDGLLIRLEQGEDGIRAETFSEEELAIVTRESIEVR
ncbi:MAG: ATP/GTP-binding protein [Elainellaceae cyanobacterium]